MMSISHLMLFLLTQTLAFSLADTEPTTYRAAILEHDVHSYVSSPLETMLSNVKTYSDAAIKAKDMGVDLLVFPKNGIVGLDQPPLRKNEYYIYLTSNIIGSVPCDALPKNDGRETYRILEILSCIARNNSLVVVANVLTEEPCNQTQDPSCPATNFFKYNTNVVFNKDGTLVARYHTRHLIGPATVNAAKKDDYEIVEVGFVKFGILTSFDAMYADRLLEYVTKHDVRNVVLVNAWYDELPFLTAIQLASRMARGLGINIINANLYAPLDSRFGSGIYSSVQGAINETNDLSTPGRLLIADLPVNPPSVPETRFECSITQQNVSVPIETENIYRIQSAVTSIPTSSPTYMLHQIWYHYLQNYSRVFLESKEGNASLCEGDLCCHLEYAFDEEPTQDLYTFAIHEAPHPFGNLKFHMQVCSVLKCESKDIETCGKIIPTLSSVKFSRLSLTGSFATTTLFPSILTPDLQSFPDSQWVFTKGECSGEQTQFKYGGKMELTSSASKPILAASIYGQIYTETE